VTPEATFKDEVWIEREALNALAIGLLEAHGAPAEHARIVAQHLVEADSRGVRSHGTIRLLQYVEEIRTGELDPSARSTVEVRRGQIRVDGNRTFGQVVGTVMVGELTSLARDQGIAIAVGRRLGHTGRVGAYPEQLAKNGLVAIGGSSGPPSGHWVAPFGGRDGRIATNPIAIAWPVMGEEPIIADFSTSATPEGIVRGLRDRRLAVPEGTLRDADGEPSTDPAVLYATPRGAIQPFGGNLGYRGTALGLFVEVLSTLLAGDAVDDARRMGSNLTLIAIDPGAGFADLAAGLGRHVRSSRPIDAARPVLMPGDRERAREDESRAIPFYRQEWASLSAAAREVSVELPSAVVHD
jgi:hydroxycarboxylate dehydrogenase B